MALITCPKCGKRFSDHAEKCPLCGASKEEVQRLIAEKKTQEAAERERLRKEREAKEAEETHIRAEKRAAWWKKNRKYVYLLIFVTACLIAYFPINAYLHTPKWKLEDGVLTISPHFSIEATMKDCKPIWEPGRYKNMAPWYSKRNEIKSVIIDDGVKNIGSYAFYDCFGLTSIEIPNSVTSIGGSAFKNCSGFPIENNIRYADTYLIEAIDKTLSTYYIKQGTRWIGDGAFWGCHNMSSVIIPNSVTSIGSLAFANCTGLTSIEIPNSVTCMGESPFIMCKSLLSVRLPERFRVEVDVLPSYVEAIYY